MPPRGRSSKTQLATSNRKHATRRCEAGENRTRKQFGASAGSVSRHDVRERSSNSRQPAPNNIVMSSRKNLGGARGADSTGGAATRSRGQESPGPSSSGRASLDYEATLVQRRSGSAQPQPARSDALTGWERWKAESPARSATEVELCSSEKIASASVFEAVTTAGTL